MKRQSIKTIAIIVVLVVGVLYPTTRSIATGKGEAGNGGEVEFYYEDTSTTTEPKPKPKPDPKPKPKPKPIIKLPQTGNQTTPLTILIGSSLIVVVAVLGFKRRKAHD
ncbi:LPXTG cell wall anchor domain-containing protein [Vagococcus salmoninarum]|uniref:LPXTG cell wall anchor domain-containing protein n=1 Tax=Vagococcus salmoninarum TaxID=2739 RepID=UPI003F95E476